jgi:hypothetical protein
MAKVKGRGMRGVVGGVSKYYKYPLFPQIILIASSFLPHHFFITTSLAMEPPLARTMHDDP